MPIAFFSGGPGPGELGLIFLVVLIVFGPKRLPAIARSLGKVIADLRHASQDFKDQIMSMDVDSTELVDSRAHHEEDEAELAPVSSGMNGDTAPSLPGAGNAASSSGNPPDDNRGEARHDLAG